MAELRYNPFKKDWVMIASARQNRPQMPENWCPFCLGSGKVPDYYDVYEYDNDFPALSENPPVPDDVATDFFKAEESYGKCEVILYSPEHTASLSELSVYHVTKLVGLWCERFDALRQDSKSRYIMIFENRGEIVGVTMPHPHGQIYSYPFLPKKLELELNSANEYKDRTGNCLYCDWLKAEQDFEKRVLFENEYFSAIIPFFSEVAYGVYIISKRHKQYITDFTRKERECLASAVRNTAGMLDSLFDIPLPYMMCMHNAPVNLENMEGFHFHIEFIPPMRSKVKQQFFASSETGAWAHCNPTAPEEKAKELRTAYLKYVKDRRND